MKTTMFILVACAATFACAKAVGPVPLEDAVFVDMHDASFLVASSPDGLKVIMR